MRGLREVVRGHDNTGAIGGELVKEKQELFGVGGVEAGEWFVSPALAQDVITPGPADLWSDVMKRQPMPLPLYSTYPVNVEDN